MNLVGPAGVVLKALRRRRHLDLTRFEDRLAVVQRLEARDLVRSLEQLLADLPHDASAIARRQPAPRSVERRASGGNRRIHVRLLRYQSYLRQEIQRYTESGQLSRAQWQEFITETPERQVDLLARLEQGWKPVAKG